MKRLIVILTVVLALLVGTVVVVSAQTPGNGFSGCGGWGAAATNGNYDYTANATFKSVADKLGLSAADLAKELLGGKSIADLAGAKNVSLDDLVKIMDAPRNEMMQIAVKYGYMTQGQADVMNQQMESWQKSALQQKGYFGGMMGPGMMGSGGMMGGPGRGMMGGFGPRSGS